MKQKTLQMTFAFAFVCAFSLNAQLPAIVSHPQSQNAPVGTDVVFEVIASDGEPSLPNVSSGTLKLWLKADAGVMTTNNRVFQWQDQSPNLNHALQSDTDKQPVLVGGAVPSSGKPVVRFDGLESVSHGDFLQGTGDLGLFDGFTSFLVCSVKGPFVNDGQIPVLIGVPGQSSAVRTYYIFNPPNTMAFAAWQNDYLSGISIPTDTFRTWTFRLNSSKTQIDFFNTDGLTDQSSSNLTSSLATPGAGYFIGGAGSAYVPYHFNGDISEVIYYQGALTESDRLAVDNYLKQKYYASGSASSVTYQWQFNGTNIVNATNSSLTLTNVQFANAGDYGVTVANSTNSVTSSNAVLSIHLPPSIDTHPQNQEVDQGLNAAFSVTATGAFPLSYQWRFDGNAISNATDSSFSITNAQPSHAGSYSVIVSDGISSVISSNAVLTVNFAPTILNQPQSQTAYTGTNVTLSVTAFGYPLNYQWYFNSTNVIAGATDAFLVLTNIQTGDAGNYSVEVTNPLGSETSSDAVLTVINTASAIFEDFEPGIHGDQWTAFGGNVLATNYGGFVSPAHSLWFGGNGSRYATTRPIDVSSGASISFHLRLASNGSNASPVWEHVDIPNEGIVLEYSINGSPWSNIGVYNTSTFWNWTLVQLSVPHGAQSTGTLFRWRQLSNSGPSADHWALDDIQILPATSAPSIVAQPQSHLVPVGTNVTLNVVVTGQSPLAYHWVLNSTTILPSTNSSLTLTNVQLSDTGDYSVVITNSFGSVTSATATVTVLMPPAISSQPQSQSGIQGTNILFSVTASGSALNYQWQFNGTAISNAVDSTLLLTNIQGSNAGVYSVRVSNPVGSIVSSNASLTIDTFPVIAKQPESQSVISGANVTFDVGVNAVLPPVNSGALRLWLKADAGVVADAEGRVSLWQDQSSNGNHAVQANTNKQPLLMNGAVPVSGQQALRFDGVRSSAMGDFLHGSGNVGLSNGFTSFLVCSEVGLQTDHQIPVMVGVPGNSSAVRAYYIDSPNPNQMGFVAWLNDYPSGFTIPTNEFHVWGLRLNPTKTLIEFFDTDGLTNRASSSPTGGLTTPGAGYYVGAAGSGFSTYYFKGDISEILYFQGTLTDADRTAVEDYLKQKYFATASASGQLAYQWLFNGTNIVGATNSSITLTNVQPLDAGNYSVIVSNSAGAITSGNAALTVNVPPTVTIQPQDQPVNAGGTASFTVTVAGTEPFSYQWQKNSNNLANATNSTLVLNSVQTSDAGNYRVVVTSPFGTDTSSNATLSVNITKVRVVTTNATSASSFTLPIEISALGTENAVGFSLSFDSSILTFDSVALDSGLNGAILISNTAQLGGGKLGVAVALSADSTFVAGTQALVQVTFNVAVANNALNTAVNFIDLPTERQVSDAGAEILPAVFIDGTVAIAAVDFEGDVTPRPNGNRTLSITDWVQVGRFAAGLDTPAAGEFRRADCAPRDDLGNGSISITDWVQAGRYATGIDPLTPVGGPSAPAFSIRGSALTKSSEAPRSVVLETTNKVGQTHTVSARLIAQGNENAIGFSLAFDPEVLTFTGATAGGNASGALLNVNSNSLAAGRVGVALSLPPGNIFAVGTQEVIKLTFTSAVGATGSTSLTFTSVPISCEVSDTTANALVANFANATLVISVPGPLLTINMSEAGAILSWPSSASNFVLETSSAIGAEWTSADGNVVTNEQSISTTLPISEQPQFYRLKQK